MQNDKKFNINDIGSYLATKRGIEQLIDVSDKGSYTTKLLIDKEAFILAYERYILKTEN